MNTSSEKYKIKASIWKHPRILEVLGKQIAEELEEKKDEYAKELQEKKDQLERLNRYHTALQSIRITTEFIQKNNISYAALSWGGAKKTAFEIFGSWNFMNDIDEGDLIAATRILKNKIADKLSEDII